MMSARRLYLHSLQLYKLNLPHCPCSLQVTHREPYALYEYKPNVDSSLLSIDRRDFAKLLLQAFYTLRNYNVESCLFCLTSLTSWHYFRFTLKGRKLSCLQRQTFQSRDRYVASSKEVPSCMCLVSLYGYCAANLFFSHDLNHIGTIPTRVNISPFMHVCIYACTLGPTTYWKF